MKRFLFILISVILFVCCEEKTSQSTEITAKVYVDLLIAKEKYYSEKDSLAISQSNIFSNYGLSKSEYEKNLSHIKYNNDDWNEFFKFAEAYLDTLKKSDVKQ